MLNVRTLAIAASAAIVVSSCGSNESAEAVVASAPVNHTVDAAASTLTWTGTKVGGAHTGTISISEGSFVLSGDTVTGGTITIDMLTIKNTDLEADTAQMNNLVRHLNSPDFFGVDSFPTATFEIVSAIPDSTLANGATHRVSGNLTIKGKTNPVSCDATVSAAAGTVTIDGVLTVDRSLYDVSFGLVGEILVDANFDLAFHVVGTAEVAAEGDATAAADGEAAH